MAFLELNNDSLPDSVKPYAVLVLAAGNMILRYLTTHQVVFTTKK